MDFEKKLSRLENIVEQMEQGELSLDKSLKLFEEGVKNARECNEELNKAEERVKLLLKVDAEGNAITQDFGDEDEA